MPRGKFLVRYKAHGDGPAPQAYQPDQITYSEGPLVQVSRSLFDPGEECSAIDTGTERAKEGDMEFACLTGCNPGKCEKVADQLAQGLVPEPGHDDIIGCFPGADPQ